MSYSGNDPLNPIETLSREWLEAMIDIPMGWGATPVARPRRHRKRKTPGGLAGTDFKDRRHHELKRAKNRARNKAARRARRANR